MQGWSKKYKQKTASNQQLPDVHISTNKQIAFEGSFCSKKELQKRQMSDQITHVSSDSLVGIAARKCRGNVDGSISGTNVDVQSVQLLILSDRITVLCFKKFQISQRGIQFLLMMHSPQQILCRNSLYVFPLKAPNGFWQWSGIGLIVKPTSLGA